MDRGVTVIYQKTIQTIIIQAKILLLITEAKQLSKKIKKIIYIHTYNIHM